MAPTRPVRSVVTGATSAGAGVELPFRGRPACCLCMKIRPDVYPCGERSPWGADSRLGLLTATHGLVDHEPRKSASRPGGCFALPGSAPAASPASLPPEPKPTGLSGGSLTGCGGDRERPFMECRSSLMTLDRVRHVVALRAKSASTDPP